MNKKDLKIGMKVQMDKFSKPGRKEGVIKGEVIGIYERYALIQTVYGYKEAYAFMDINIDRGENDGSDS